MKKRGRLPASDSVSAKPKVEHHRPTSRDTENRDDGLTAQSTPLTASPSLKSAGDQASVVSESPRRSQTGDCPGPNGLVHADAAGCFVNSRPPEKKQRGSASMSVHSLIQSGFHRHGRSDTNGIHLRPGSSSLAVADNYPAESDTLHSDESAGFPSPTRGTASFDHDGGRRHRASFRSISSNGVASAASGGMALAPDGPSPDLLQKAPTEDCCYKFLDPVLPYIRNILPASVACELLDIFLTDPGSSLFRGASPYILTRIIRKKSILHTSKPRHTTPALLATILWCVAQTADVMLLHVPGTRAKVVNDLYDLATSLISERDPDRWRRIHGEQLLTALLSHFCSTIQSIFLFFFAGAQTHDTL